MESDNKKVMGSAIVIAGVVSIILSFYTMTSGDPAEWVLTEEGRAIKMITMLFFLFGFMIVFTGLGILIMDTSKGSSFTRNPSPFHNNIPAIHPPQHPSDNPHVASIPMARSICPVCGLPVEMNMKPCPHCEKGDEGRGEGGEGGGESVIEKSIRQ